MCKLIDDHKRKEGRDNFFFVEDDEKQHVHMIYYQNSTMKAFYQNFGEMLFIDGTYKLNKNSYPVYVIAVQDRFGNAQIVAVALIAFERISTISCIFEQFAKLNDITKTKSIMIDKDLKEHAVLSAVFGPDVRILYCWFHVANIFTKQFGKQETKEIATQMMFAETVDDFNQLKGSFVEKAFENALHYFEKNWLNCLPMWAKAYRDNVVSFKNETNNMVETINGKLKDYVKKSSTMDLCVAGVLSYIDFLAEKHKFKTYYEK